ncbi:MAG: hypothetical protein KJN69_10285 [Gammaproteobacteria bacterium]|nr:hypothetical protein [Gammaproteobacteria bacterium]
MRNFNLKKPGFIEAMVVTVVVAASLFFVVWHLATTRIVPETEDLQGQVGFLSGELAVLKKRMEQTQARQVVLAQETEVLRQANRLLREHESERQAEMGSLQSELDFFRRLAGTGGTQSGLDIYRVEISATDSDRVFRFVLTLTQNIRRASIISGQARIEVEGTMDDRPEKLAWSQISDPETPKPAFRFKYFQQLEGYLTLPGGFSPTRLLITLESEGQRKPASRGYNWSQLENH